MKRLPKFARITLVVVAGFVLLVAVLLLYLWASGRIWYPRQRARVEELTAQHSRPLPVNDDLDDSLPLNSLRLIASHNSYHLEPDGIRRLLIGLAEPDEPEKLRYSHNSLWEQLEHGIRSFELDVRARGRRFTITHVPLVDNRGPHPDFLLTLQELLLWSETHPGHVPMVVLLELKRDWMILDPGLQEWTSATLQRLDQAVVQTIPSDRLLTPDMVRGDSTTMVDAVRGPGWPPLSAARGRMIFVIHTDDEIDPLYVAGDPSLAGRPLFTSRPGGDDADGGSDTGVRPDAVFVIHNEPDPESISAYTNAALMVRTRADADGDASPDRRALAVESGAQIISTDFPPGHPNDPSVGIVEFDGGRTVLQIQE